MQIDAGERIHLRRAGVFERDVFKVDRAVRDVENRFGGVGERGLLVHDLGQSLHRLGRHREHDVDHRDHHQAHQDLEAVGQHRRELADVDRRAVAGDDELGADREDEDHVEVQAQLHQGRVEGDDALGIGEVPADVVRGGGKFLLFVFLARKALDDAHRAHVLLDGFVELVILAEYRAEGGHRLARDHNEPEGQHRHEHDEGRRERAAHDIGHHDGKDEHQRGADRDAGEHHEGHLHVADVRRHARDERGGRKPVDILKREVLDSAIDVVAQIAGEARRGLGAQKTRRRAEGQ